ncbi:MAG TPA: YdcF family protein [Terriglobales bacterium]|nr:YdcF family protein [Terriglobales bacterium]
MSSTVSIPSIKKKKSRALLMVKAVAVAATVAASFLLITSIRIARQAERNEARPAGAIIVFGAAEYVGRPSPVYRARLDHAYDLFQQGIAPVVITTGGSGLNSTYSEGSVGRDYLIARGIPDRNLIAETQSVNTAQSAKRTAAILRKNHIADAVAVSDAYHVFRIKQMMKAQHVTVYGSPRPSSLPRTRSRRVFGTLREAVSYMFWRLHLT